MPTTMRPRESREQRKHRLIHQGAAYRAEIRYLKNGIGSRLFSSSGSSRETSSHANHGGSRLANVGGQVMSMASRLTNLKTLRQIQMFMPIVTGIASILGKRSLMRPLTKAMVVLSTIAGVTRFFKKKKLRSTGIS